MAATFQEAAGVTDGRVHRQGLDFCRHHLPDDRRAEDVGLIVTGHAQAPPRQLLGHQALAQQGPGDQVGDHCRQHERQDDLVVPGQFEQEHDGGEGGASRGPERRRHGHEGEGAGRDVGAREDP